MRITGWQNELNRYITEVQDRYRLVGYIPGEFDCCTFAADWILRLTGEDPLADYRDQYKTEAEAFELVAAREGSLKEALIARFGDPIHPSHALRGDLAFIESMTMCGIVFTVGGKSRVLFIGEGGFSVRRDREVARHGCCFAVR